MKILKLYKPNLYGIFEFANININLVIETN